MPFRTIMIFQYILWDVYALYSAQKRGVSFHSIHDIIDFADILGTVEWGQMEQ